MRRTPPRRERGAAVVEAAIILPLLLVLAIGLSEIGFAAIDRLTMANAAREGARVGAAAGDSANADLSILRSVEQASCSLHYGSLVSVEIYEADANGDPSDPASKLNRYTPSGSLNCTNSATTNLTCANGCPWTAGSRSTVVTNLDEVGIKVTYTHDWITGIPPWTGSVTWTDQTVMRLEPDNGLGS